MPLVTADWPGCAENAVQLDLEDAGYQAARHLLEHGHRRVGLVTYRFELPNIRPLNDGYRRALAEAEIEPLPGWIAPTQGFDIAAGREAAHSLLALPEPPSAIFAVSDLLAIGAMQAAQEAGLRIPQDLALIGFNDIPLAALAQPPLSSVAAPAHALGAEAMKMLAALIAGRRPRQRKVILPVELIVRESCGAHPG